MRMEEKIGSITNLGNGISLSSSSNHQPDVSDALFDLDEIHHVSNIKIKYVGESKVLGLELTSYEGLQQWITLDGSVNMRFIDVDTCIDCGARINDSVPGAANHAKSPVVACESCGARYPGQECLQCEEHLIRAFVKNDFTVNDNISGSCSRIDATRNPEEWWPRCLSDHAIIITAHDDFTLFTWRIVLKSEAHSIASMLGGSCRAIFANSDLLMDLHEALDIISVLVSLFKGINFHEEMTEMTLPASSAPTISTACITGTTSTVKFIPGWQFTVQQRLTEFLHYNARTCNDGGLWLVGLINLKERLMSWNEFPKQGFTVANVIGYQPAWSSLANLVEKIVNKIRVKNHEDFTLLDFDIIGPEFDAIPGLESIIPDSDCLIHGEIIGFHGSVIIFRQGTRYFGSDLCDILNKQPIFRDARLEPGKEQHISVNEEKLTIEASKVRF